MEPEAAVRWSDSLLDSLRLLGDPLADAALASLASPGHAARARAAAPEPADAFAAIEQGAAAGDPACQALLSQVNDVPAWVSFPRMHAGCRMSLSHPVAGGLSLLAGALAESYASALGAKVLVRTGNLERSTRRRVYETAEFLNTLALAYGPQPGTAGHRALVNLRLLHARIRAGMRRLPDWDMRWGLPVNQEDYGGTLILFSHVYSRCMRRLGVPVTDAEVDSLHHGWRYSGYVLGVDPRLLSESPADEAALYAAIARRQFHPDDDSRALLRAMLSSMAWQPPFLVSEPALCAICRDLLGDGLADAMGVPRSAAWRAAPRLLRLCEEAQHRVGRLVPGYPQLSERLGKRAIRAVLRYGLPGRL